MFRMDRMWSLPWLVAAVVLAGGLVSCVEDSSGLGNDPGAVPPGREPAAAEPDEESPAALRGVHPSAPVRGEFLDEVLLTGELQAVRATTILAPETSIFQMRIQYLAEEGSVVHQGDPLVDFDNSALADRVLDLETRILDAETQIAAKRSELATALMDLQIERTEKKYEADRTEVRADVDPEVLSRKEFAEREFDRDKAARQLSEVEERIEMTRSRGQAELDVLVISKEKLERDLVSTRKDLDVLSVKAPIDGLVVYGYQRGSQVKWKEGDSVWPGQPIVELPDLSQMEIQFQVSEVDAHKLSVGMRVTITIDSLPDRSFSGEIVEIPSMAVTRDEESSVRIFRVRSSLSETIAGVMKPGMSVLGRVVVSRHPEALMALRESVLCEGERCEMLVAGAGEAEPAWMEITPVSRNARYYLLESPPGTSSASTETTAPASEAGL